MQKVRTEGTESRTDKVKAFVGIDPGVSGAIAAIDDDGVIFDVVKMPETLEETYLCIKAVTSWFNCRAAIELVTGFIAAKGGEGGPQPGARMFTFGKSYGSLLMAMIATGLKENETFLKVAPRTWQSELGIYSGQLTYSQRKARNRKYARDLFLRKNGSRRSIIGDTADALLIAEYCRRRFL